jgi:LysR family transcriptional regulator, cys regulon transcriptional activator
MTLTQLKFVVAIADCNLNITQAAEKVHATQPGLSKQIKVLEDDLGFQIFTRRGRSLESITQAGEEVVKLARRILQDAASIRAFAANTIDENRGSLSIHATPTQARYVLPFALARLQQRYPDIDVHLQSGDEAEALRQLSADGTDLAIVSTSGRHPSEGLAIPLYRWHRKALVPKTHPLAGARRLTLEQLLQYPIITYPTATKPDSSFQRAFANAQSPRIAMTALEGDLIKTYVRAGLGVGVVSEVAIGFDSDLAVLELPKAFAECTCFAVLPNKRVLRNYVVDLLVDLAPQLDRIDLRRAITGAQAWQPPPAPTWVDLSQSMTV